MLPTLFRGLLMAALAVALMLSAGVAQAATYITFVRPSVPEAQYVNGLPITVKVTSPNIVRVELAADGYAFGEPLTAANGWSINYTFSRIGLRNLVATGYDISGKVVSKTTTQMNVVNIFPSNPRPETDFGNGTPVTVVAAAQVSKVLLYADGYLIGSDSSRDQNGNFSFVPATMTTVGPRTFLFVAYNAAGVEVDRQSFKVNVINLGFIAPLVGSNYVTGTSIEASVITASNVARVEYYTGASVFRGSSTDRSSNFRVSFKAGPVGAYTLEARAFNAAGVQLATFSVKINVVPVPVVTNKWGVWLFQFESVARVATTHAQLASILKGMGVSRIYIKVADGTRDVLSNGYTFPLRDPSVPAAYKAAGIEPWAWAYNYPSGRSSASGQGSTLYQAAKTGYVGFVSDFEAEFQTASVADQVEVFQAFASAKRAAISDGYASPSFKLYGTSFGQIDLQPNIAIRQIDAYIDGHMPQTYSVYWGSDREADQAGTIAWITGKYRARGATKPIHHIASNEVHFDRNGKRHQLTAARMQAFLENGGYEASIWVLPASGDGTGQGDVPFSTWDLLKSINWRGTAK